jgi:hypothetical protein
MAFKVQLRGRRSKVCGWIQYKTAKEVKSILVRPSDSYAVIATPPKELTTKKSDVFSEEMKSILNTKIVLDGETFEVLEDSSKYVKLRSTDTDGGKDVIVVSVLFENDLKEFKISASIAVFLKRCDWHTDAVAIRTEDGDPYWLGKALGQAKKADEYVSKTSGGEIPVGWLCMPIQWYTVDPKKPLTYTLLKGRHMLDLLHAIRVPNVVLAKEGGTKSTFTVAAKDDKRIMAQLARQKKEQITAPL